MRLLRNQEGLTMLEVLIAVSILGFVGAAFMIGMTSAFQAQEINEEQVMAENLVRAALENVRFLPFNAAGYQTEVDAIPRPSGYSITVETQDFCLPPPDPCTPDGNIQKNTVRVSRDGKAIVTVEDLKTNR